MVDTGYFLILSGISILLTLLSFKYIGSYAQVTFNVIAFVAFMALALPLVSGETIGTDITTNDTITVSVVNGSTGDPITNSTETVAGTTNEPFISDFTQLTIIGFVYFSMGIVNAILVAVAMFGARTSGDM